MINFPGYDKQSLTLPLLLSSQMLNDLLHISSTVCFPSFYALISMMLIYIILAILNALCAALFCFLTDMYAYIKEVWYKTTEISLLKDNHHILIVTLALGKYSLSRLTGLEGDRRNGTNQINEVQ